ncbi:hypothetical protein Tco_1407390 [Tanacetum coccineum]
MVAGTTKEEKYDVQVEKGRLAEMVFSSSGEELKNKNAFELEKHVERSVVWVQAIFRSKEQKKIIRSNTCYSAQANKHRKRVVFQEGDLVWIHLRKERFSAGRFGKLKPRVDAMLGIRIVSVTSNIASRSSSDLEVSFPSELETRFLIRGYSLKSNPRYFYLGTFSILFIRDPLSPVFDTLLLFSSENEEKVFNPGSLSSNEEKSPHLFISSGL